MSQLEKDIDYIKFRQKKGACATMCILFINIFAEEGGFRGNDGDNFLRSVYRFNNSVECASRKAIKEIHDSFGGITESIIQKNIHPFFEKNYINIDIEKTTIDCMIDSKLNIYNNSLLGKGKTKREEKIKIKRIELMDKKDSLETERDNFITDKITEKIMRIKEPCVFFISIFLTDSIAGHAVLAFKLSNQFYFFDPNKGFKRYSSPELLAEAIYECQSSKKIDGYRLRVITQIRSTPPYDNIKAWPGFYSPVARLFNIMKLGDLTFEPIPTTPPLAPSKLLAVLQQSKPITHQKGFQPQPFSKLPLLPQKGKPTIPQARPQPQPSTSPESQLPQLGKKPFF